MKRSRFTSGLTLACLLGLSLFASCKVDKSGLTFDDDAYNDLLGDGDGDGDGDTGGSVNGDGDGDGDGDMGGAGTGGVIGTGGEFGLGGAGTGGGFMAGDTRCSEENPDQVEFFVGGDLWVPLGSPCEFVCSEGECIGVCEPEDTECVSGTEVRTCDAAGAWNTTPCDFACLTATGACGGECVPGDRQCLGQQKQQCTELGAWENDGDPCPGTCSEPDPGSAVCTGSCSPEEAIQCVNNRAYQQCTAGEWVDMGNCPFACVNDACDGTCIPGTSWCEGNSRVSCNGQGVPSAPSYCDGSACLEEGSTAQCGGVCEPGKTDCRNGNVAQCNASGEWEEKRDCAKLGDELKLPMQCRAVGKPTDPKHVCGECPYGDGETEVSRCHTTTDHTTVNELCTFDGEQEVTLWKVDKECERCYQGSCVEDVRGLCSTDNTARGCINIEVAWGCDSKGNYIEGGCPQDPFGAQMYCEHTQCESMPEKPYHYP